MSHPPFAPRDCVLPSTANRSAGFLRPKRTERALLGALLLAASLAGSRLALAGPSAADRETARTLLVEGDLRTERKEYDRALQPYQAAHAIMKLPSTGLAVARTLIALGRLVEARDVVMSVVRLPVEPDEPDAVVKARVEASRLAADLERRIPTVRVVTSRGELPARVELDGREVPSAMANLPYKLDPGKHDARVRWSSGREAHQSFSLEEGRHEVVVFEAAAAGPGVAASAARSPASTSLTPREDPAAAQWPTLAYVGYGTAAVALAAGAVTGALAWSRTSKLERDCPGLTCLCTNESCRSARQDDIDGISTMATMSNVSFGIALIGAGVGTVALLSDRSEARGAGGALRVNAFAGWGRVGVQGGF